MLASAPCVWVVILDYNTGPLLLDCVASFVEVNYPNFHLIVVDNASTDGIVDQVAEHYPQIKLLKLDNNLGYCGGNNAGIQYALENGATYVLVVNPDTIVINSNFITDLVVAMQRNPDAGIIGPLVHFRDRGILQRTSCNLPYLKRKLLSWFLNRHQPPIQCRPDSDTEVEVLNGVCIFFRRNMLLEVGLFDQNIFMYGDDWDMTIRAQKKGWKSYQIPVDSILHLQKKEGYDYLSMTNFLLKRNAVYVLLKHGYRFDSIIVALGGLTLSFLRLVRASLHYRERKKYWDFFTRLCLAYIAVFRRRAEDKNFGPPVLEWKKS